MYPWTTGEWGSRSVSLTNVDATDTRPRHLRRYYVPSYAVMLCWQSFMQCGGELISFEVILVNTDRLMMLGSFSVVSIQLNGRMRLRSVALCAFLSYWRISIPFRGRLHIRIVRTDTSFRGWRHGSVRCFSWSLVSTGPDCDRLWVLNNLDILLTHLFNLDALLFNVSWTLITKIVTDLCLTSVTATSKIICRV